MRLLSRANWYYSGHAAKIAAVQDEANRIERDLAKRSVVMAERKRLATVTWRDVQKMLAPGDAAIEFVRFPFYDGKNRTGATKYVALVVTPDTKGSPALV